MADSGSLGKMTGSAGLAEELHPFKRGLCKVEDDNPAGPQTGGRDALLLQALLLCAEAVPAS